MNFLILGPLEVSADDGTLELGGPKQRALLALLIVEANRVVSSDRLIAALWEDEPPATARKALQVYVAQLRKLLGKDRVVTQKPGYLLQVNPGELDLERFERLRDEGRLDEALALWRGPPLSDFAYDRFAQTEISRLEELRMSALEERIERDLQNGRHLELIGELDALVTEYPLRERLCGQLMLALYRSDRQAEALDAFQRTRTALVEELGIEPSRDLRELHQAILNQDVALNAPAIPTTRQADTTEPGRAGLPRGTVTLLFADIEGSTRLMRTLGHRYPAVRARARELIRSVASEHGGNEVDWAGDGAFLVFARAGDAVAAAADLQRKLDGESWPSESAVRMRVGLHTGEPELGPEGYVGMDVHVGARICSAGHGGQVLVSRTTRDVVTIDPVEGYSFRPLGRHRLKDIPDHESLFQLIAPGLEESFPPLRTLGGVTLPALHHRLVGRSEDLAEILELLENPAARLVTITGSGGAGKSRLALEAAASVSVTRPVHLVGLASISEPSLVQDAIARALGVRESPGLPLLEAIADALSGTRTLLFLDNLEHLAPASRDVAALLDRVADLDVLATSRTPLHLSGEHVFQLDPLPLDDATTLFVELAATRGVQLHPEWLPTVRSVCERVDCLPLAIELVVAPLAVLPPAELLRALGEGLALEMEAPVDLPERQRTLRATIDWSYGLLTKCQRELHGALAVFAGGAPLDSVRVVCDEMTSDLLADLTALVDGGLVRRETAASAEPRFTMLATVREYALEALAIDSQLERMRSLHADYFLDLAEEAEAGLEGGEQTSWLDRVERDLDNIRGALSFAFESGRVEIGLRIAAALSRFWRAHAHVGEARRWLLLGLDQSSGVPADVRARALWAAERQAIALHATDEARALAEEALVLFREAGREREEVFALSELAWLMFEQDQSRAEALSEEAVALARALGDPRAISGALNVLSSVVAARGDHERALVLSEEALALRRSLGDRLLLVDSVYNLGEAAFSLGDIGRARSAYEEALALALELGDRLHAAHAICMLGVLALLEGDPHLASKLVEESLATYVELADRRASAECYSALAGVAAATGNAEDAARLWGVADALREDDSLNPIELAVEERFVMRVREELGEDPFTALRNEGRQQGPEVRRPRVLSNAAAQE